MFTFAVSNHWTASTELSDAPSRTRNADVESMFPAVTVMTAESPSCGIELDALLADEYARSDGRITYVPGAIP